MIHCQSFERGFHHVVEVRTEDVGTNGIGNRTDSVSSDTTEIALLFVGKLNEGNETLDGLLKVRDELVFSGVGGRSNGTSDGDLDRCGTVLKEDKETFHEEGKVVNNVVTEDLEVRVQTCAGILLGGGVDNEVEEDLKLAQSSTRTYRNNAGMSSSTLFCQPLAQASKSDTSCLSDNDLLVLQTTLDDSPELVNMRSDEITTSLNRHTKGHES